MTPPAAGLDLLPGIRPASVPGSVADAVPALDAPPPPLAVPPAGAVLPPPPRPIEAPHLAFGGSPGVPRTPFGKMIYQTALRYALNPEVVAALIEVESDFNPRAVSRKGARGLMQLIPSTARRFGLMRRRDLLNPAKNLDAGVRYLRWLVDHFGDDATRVLAAYNAGEGAVERFGGVPPFAETRDYVHRIFARLGFSLELPALALPAFAGSGPEASR